MGRGVDYAGVARLPRLILTSLLAFQVACSSGSPTPPGEDVTPGGSTREPPGVGRPARFLTRVACNLPREELLRVWRGYFPGRSGEIALIPEEPNTLGTWFPHSGPWDYLQRVPMLWYGPGQVPARGRIGRWVSMADVAPTMAEYLDFDFEAPDGSLMAESIMPQQDRPSPPRIILVVVWDGGGRNLLSEYPRAWPVLRGLIPKGVWYEQAEVGSSPSLTPPIHATLGTGAFPRHHGVVDARLRFKGGLARPEETWPEVLDMPTLADLYDRARGNEPKVGVIAYLSWHLGMVGYGSFMRGGDKDIALLRRAGRWVPAGRGRYYRFPTYVRDIPTPSDEPTRLDRQDDEADGKWFGLDVGVDDEGTRSRIVAAEQQTSVIQEVIRREGFGADDVPDLLFTNYKEIDNVSHGAALPSPQIEAALRSSDRELGRLIAMLDREVGRGEWAMLVTADHGVTPRPEASGGVAMHPRIFADDVRAAYDGDGDDRHVLAVTRPAQGWIDMGELREKGYSLADLARFITRYTRGQYAEDPSELSERDRRTRLFSAAIPGPILERLPCLPGS
jgi:hypothetical protein